MILVLFATDAEAQPFLSGKKWQRESIGQKALFTPARRSAPPSPAPTPAVEVMVCGIGQTNTAHALTAYFEHSLPELVVMGGCAGAFKGSGLKVGDVCFATEEVYADTGIYSPEGFNGLGAICIPLAEMGVDKFFNRFPVLDLSDKIKKKDFKFRTSSGPFATVCAVTGTDSSAAEIESRWAPLCENMEGAAAAHVSLLYDIPFSEARGISNIVEDRDRSRWDMDKACENCAKVIWKLLERL